MAALKSQPVHSGNNRFRIWDDLDELVQGEKDFRIIVKDTEVKVHKDLLIFLSGKFCSEHLTNPDPDDVINAYKVESCTVYGVTTLFELIYTGKLEVVMSSTVEQDIQVLQTALYFDIPRAIKVLTKALSKKLSLGNCFDMLKFYETHQLSEGVKDVRRFVLTRRHDVVKHLTTKDPERFLDLSSGGMKLLIDSWEEPEWILMHLLEAWMEDDLEGRKPLMCDLLKKLNFYRLSLLQIETARIMFKMVPGDWQDYLDQAVEYHNMPIHLKILNGPKNCEDDMVEAMMPTSAFQTTMLYMEREANTEGEHITRECQVTNNFNIMRSFKSIIINNFLVVFTGNDDAHAWHAFDPKTMVWTKLPCMSETKLHCTPAFYNGKLYILGGQCQNYTYVSKDIEAFNLRTGKWGMFARQPDPRIDQAACGFGDYLYVCGGLRDVPTVKRKGKKRRPAKEPCMPYSSDILERLDLRTKTWEGKASMPSPVDGHQMFAMTLFGKEMLVVLGFVGDHLFAYYEPGCDQWSWFKQQFYPTRYRITEETQSKLYANSIVFRGVQDTKARSSQDKEKTVQWIFPSVDSNNIQVKVIADCRWKVSFWGAFVQRHQILLPIRKPERLTEALKNVGLSNLF